MDQNMDQMFRVHRERINLEGPQAQSLHNYDQSLLDHQRFVHEHEMFLHEHQHMQRIHDEGMHPRTYMLNDLQQGDGWQPRRPTPNARDQYESGHPMQR